MRPEDRPPRDERLRAIAELARARRFDEAAARLRAATRGDVGLLLDAIGVAERAADDAWAAGALPAAVALLELALEGYRADASFATSGAEGMARSRIADDVEARLAGWRARARLPVT